MGVYSGVFHDLNHEYKVINQNQFVNRQDIEEDVPE